MTSSRYENLKKDIITVHVTDLPAYWLSTLLNFTVYTIIKKISLPSTHYIFWLFCLERFHCGYLPNRKASALIGRYGPSYTAR